MADADETRTRRPRRSRAAKEHLDRLMQNKQQLDSDKAEREKREKAALARFAEAVARVDGIEEQRQRRIADLERQKAQAEQDAKNQAAEVENDKAAALVELNELGRRAEDIAALVDLPVKRVRKMLRSQQPPKQAAEPDDRPQQPADAGDESPSGDQTAVPASEPSAAASV